jgi:hypothetical protein
MTKLSFAKWFQNYGLMHERLVDANAAKRIARRAYNQGRNSMKAEIEELNKLIKEKQNEQKL